MCVDDKDLSAYLDGELDKKKKAGVEAHLEECTVCRSRLDSLGRLANIGSPSEDEINRRKERTFSRISVAVERKPEPPVWRRKINLSLPLAAAAAVVLILLGGLGVTLTGITGSPDHVDTREIPVVEKEFDSSPFTLARKNGEPTQEELEELFRFLSEKGASVEVKIELPQSSNFTVYGEPRLIKAADIPKSKENPAN